MGTSITECDEEDEDEDVKDSDDDMKWDGDASDSNASMIVGALRMVADSEHDDDDDKVVIESYNDVGSRTRQPARSMQPAVKRRTTTAAQPKGRKRSVSASRVADDVKSVASDLSDPETCGKSTNG